MTTVHNFLPEQYRQTNQISINHNYLAQQFADHDVILNKIREVVIRGDFTLGAEVDVLEREYAELNGVRHAIGVGSGTDALFLSLKALGIDKGDEVITTPFTFYATIGAIVTAGATPVFVDAGADYNIDASQIEAKITPRTKAIMPVHWSGKPCDMDTIEAIAERHGLAVVSDACHAIKARYKGRPSGSLGTIACFSFHPLKNLNVWGDGGIITTNSDELADKLRLLRNHGLVGRDECRVFAYNSRLDTVQAVVARHLLGKIDHITESRVSHAAYFDQGLRSIPQITVPAREPDIYQVYHLYQILCENRNALQAYLIERGVDAKAHYPVPMHLQPAAAFLGHKAGDFPVTEKISAHTLSLPVHEFITREQQDFVIQLIRDFYA
ncbi:DegT/DnrJ/EryC1/StrS family aminotransferase [Viridibacterium curvum]|uniref:DegT/DnrJ/EryC1/StrS family aminotransferase n=1 Tax=Viridibacterium curvum TaxID=1101404 RepID=A0ABP9QL59_9RHOO